MGKAKTKGKERLDKFYHLAKEQGYRSRAAFKLLQLDAKFQFLPSARSLLDLCAAPGGWMQVAVKHMPVGSFVLGVDLFPIRPIRGALSLEEDITTDKCRAAIKKRMKENGCSMFNVVVHDGSPNIGGAWAQEATTQSALVIDAVRLATEFLAPKGIFVTKVFRSQDYSAILYCLKQLFDKVEVTKPVASRSTSAEIYVVGLRYKAPAKIDPRLLDMKHLFQGAIDPPKVVDVLRGTKQKRNREGYEDGSTILRKVCSASDFIWSDTPLDILGSVTSISFEDPACLSIKDHALTTEEIKALCDDLRVLAKQDFKYLLKWRMHMRKALSPTQKVAPKAADAEDENKVNDDERILNEMEELTFAMDRKKKREKKILAKRRAKDKARKATGMQIDVMEDGYQDLELFSLSSIKDKTDLQAVDSAQFDDENSEFIENENENMHTDDGKADSPSDIDSDKEHRRYDEQLEEFLDAAYDRFLVREGSKKQQQKRAKLALAKDSELWKESRVVDDDLYHSDHDSDKDYGDREPNPLVVPLDEEEELTQEQIMEQWFSQDIFLAAAENEIPAKNDSEDEIEEQELQTKKTDSNEEILEDIQTKKFPISKKPNNLSHPMEGNKSRAIDSEDFEIVPADESSSSSSSDESEYDSDAKAEILAYAKKMLRKKQREEILDDAYNKYTFDDDISNLPAWFVEEEKKHRQPIKPVTKEEIAAMRARFREIDARPAKKVAQAKLRKKRVAMRKLEAVRKKANSISDQADISEMSKTKMIDKLYKKAVPKKPKKEYVVAKKGVQVKGGKGKVVVDRRMKKDSRAHGMGKPGRDGSKNRVKKAKGRTGKKDRRDKGSSKASGKKGRKGKMDMSM